MGLFNWWGKKQDPLDALQKRQAELRLQLQVKSLERAVQLTEASTASTFPSDWVNFYVNLLDRYRDGVNNAYLSPIATPYDRRYGRNFPLWQTEQELNLLRAPARILCATNPYAIGLLSGLTAYVLGPGVTYRACAKDERAEVLVDGKSLVERVQDELDEWCERVEWSNLEAELFWRSREDGEYFLRHGLGDDGYTWVRTVEPEQVYQPPGANQRHWSFGIKTGAIDLWDVQLYWAGNPENPAEGDEVAPARWALGPALNEAGEVLDEMVHAKVNTKRSIKRGLTDFSFDTYDTLNSATKLRRNAGEGAAIREAIAGIREHVARPVSEVQTFQQAQIDWSGANPVTGRPLDQQRIEPGSVLDMDEFTKWVPPPAAGSTEQHLSVLQALLRAAGVRWNAPEWLSSGDASNNNRASAMVANDPFAINVTRAQKFYTQRFLRTLRIVLRHAVEAGRLPAEALEWVEVKAEAPSPVHRDQLAMAQANQIAVMNGWKSRQMVAQEEGLDWAQVEQDNEEYQEKQGLQLGLDFGGDEEEDEGRKSSRVPPPKKKVPDTKDNKGAA